MGLSNLVCEDASSEGVEPQVPNGHDCGMLQDVSAIQEQEDASRKFETNLIWDIRQI